MWIWNFFKKLQSSLGLSIDLKRLTQEYKDAQRNNIQSLQQMSFLLYTSLLTITLAELAFVATVGLTTDAKIFRVAAAIVLIIAFIILLIDLMLQSVKIKRHIKTYGDVVKQISDDVESSGVMKVLLKNLKPKYHPKNVVVKELWLAGKLYYVSMFLMSIASVLIIIGVIKSL